MILLFIYSIAIYACNHSVYQLAVTTNTSNFSGTSFYKSVATLQWKQRDSVAVEAVLGGNIPFFIKKFSRINVSISDSITGKIIHAYYFVAPDYLSIGNDNDWARIPLTPMAAQKIADSFHCFLPTRKMVDDIYKSAIVRLEPLPMFAFRDSSITMFQHHLMIEGQRKLRKGLIAGIKKDVVISSKIISDPKPNREAIYGWHLPNGKPIQPLYTGHVNWYADYSHGIRLVYEKIYVEGKPMHYTEVLSNPILKALLCDESDCSYFKYNY
jgi:hypothetical protein